MSLDKLFEVEQPAHRLKCKRCSCWRDLKNFYQGARNYALCVRCRDYNRQYLKSQKSGELMCPRCRKEKELKDFVDGPKRLKLCKTCRDYNKVYKRKLIVCDTIVDPTGQAQTSR